MASFYTLNIDIKYRQIISPGIFFRSIQEGCFESLSGQGWLAKDLKKYNATGLFGFESIDYGQNFIVKVKDGNVFPGRTVCCLIPFESNPIGSPVTKSDALVSG